MGEVRRAGAEFAAQQAAAMRARGLLAHLELGAHARLVQRMEASGQKAYFTQFQVRNPAEFVSRAGASPRRRPPAAGPPSPASGTAGGAGGRRGGARGAGEAKGPPKGALVRRRSVAVLQAAELNRALAERAGAGAAAGAGTRGGGGAAGEPGARCRRGGGVERRGSVFGSSMPVSLMAGSPAPAAGAGRGRAGGGLPAAQRRGSVFTSGLATGLDPDVEASLRRAFTRYCNLGGDSASASWGAGAEGLTASRFLKLSRDGGLVQDFTYAELDVLFASVAEAHRVDYKAFLGLLRQLHTILEDGKPGAAARGGFQAFVEARVLRSLLRATQRKDPHEKDLMSAPLWQAVFTQEHILYIVFRFYCRLADLSGRRGAGARGQTGAASAAAGVPRPRSRRLAPEHLEKFAQNFMVVPRVVTRAGLLEALREAKSHVAADDDPGLTFTEFLECLCRCALKARPGSLEGLLEGGGEALSLAPELTDRACVSFGAAQGVGGQAGPPDPRARGVWIPPEAPTQQLRVVRAYPTPLRVPEVVPASRSTPWSGGQDSSLPRAALPSAPLGEAQPAPTGPDPRPSGNEEGWYKPLAGGGDVMRVWPPGGGPRPRGRPGTANPRVGSRPEWHNPGASGPVDTGPRLFMLVGDRFPPPRPRPCSAAV